MDQKIRAFLRTKSRLAPGMSMVVLGGLAAMLNYELQATLWGAPALCGDEACSLASEALAMPTSWLYGAALSWALALLLTLPSSSPFHRETIGGLYSKILYAGLAFEGVLLGFLVKTGTPCTICLVVAGGVGLLVLAEVWRHRQSGVGAVLVWGTSIFASLLLAGPGAPMRADVDLSASAAMQFRPEGAQSDHGREYHLYVRYGCGHCEDMLSVLSRAEITAAGTWFIHTTSGHPDELHARRNAFLEANAAMGFRAMLKAKHAAPEALPVVGEEEQERLFEKSRASLQETVRFGMTGVPGMIIRDRGTTVVVVGSLPVLQALQNWGMIRM